MNEWMCIVLWFECIPFRFYTLRQTIILCLPSCTTWIYLFWNILVVKGRVQNVFLLQWTISKFNKMLRYCLIEVFHSKLNLDIALFDSFSICFFSYFRLYINSRFASVSLLELQFCLCQYLCMAKYLILKI